MKKRIDVVIPAYNEASVITEIVKDALKYSDRVIVIDDNSKNNTCKIAEESGAEVYKHIKNEGAGAATRSGFIMAKDADIVVTIDGDGQHRTDEIPMVINPILEGVADLVIGSRLSYYPYINGKVENPMPFYRRVGIEIITLAYNIGSRSKVCDAQSCFRAYSREVLDAVSIEEDGFAFSTEVLIKARKKGFRIVEVPINCIYHDSFKQNSTLNPVRHGIEVLSKTIKWRLTLGG